MQNQKFLLTLCALALSSGIAKAQDFTWLNGSSRQTSSLLQTPHFTGQFIADVNYIADFNAPQDHTVVGSTSAGRSHEVQVQHLGFGGDFNFQQVRARVMTQFGMSSTMIPRNDASPSRGAWNLADAYRYLSEASVGYKWDVMKGVYLDAGLFMAYGLLSYYNFENWIYQGSYLAANAPGYFNGLRLQIFPSDPVKLEFWLVNGWQSYGMYNEAPGVGYQISYRPNEQNAFVTNGYYGTDTLGNSARKRFHTDTSYQHKYWDRPASFISKAAFSITADLGCENGQGVKYTKGTSQAPSQYFLGAMAYNRVWFSNNVFALTVGGGYITNPGRYLVLVPPVQTSNLGPQGGASASDNSCAGCFTQNPGDAFNAWDGSVTFDYMPDPYVTFRAEYNHRESSVPYFEGPKGITSETGSNMTSTAGFTPDLVKRQDRVNLSMMVRF